MGLFDFRRKRESPPPEPAPGEGTSAHLPTPLSDLMTRALEDASGEAMRAFHRAFMNAPIGVIASRIPTGKAGVYHTGFARAATPDGRVMVLACADRAAFAQRFHDRFNADIPGRELAAAVLGIPDCAGILVNCAASFNSIAIDREQLAFLLAPA